MTVGAQLCVYVCKASRGRDGDERKMILYYWGNILDQRKVIGLVPVFGLVQKHSPMADICCLLLWHVCPCLVCETTVRVVYVCPWWSGWLSDHPDGVKSLIGGAEPGICTWFWFVQCICMSGCVIEMYTVILECVLLWLCGSVLVSGIFSVSQPLLMYWLIT